MVYIELPDVGATLTKGEILGTIESVKAASDLYAAVSGEVTEVNSVVIDEPEIVNSDPYGNAWMFKFKLSDASQLADLMDPKAYAAYCEKRG